MDAGATRLVNIIRNNVMKREQEMEQVQPGVNTDK